MLFRSEPTPTAAPAAAQPTLAPLPPPAEGTFTYWGGLIFSEDANNMLVERIEQWGQERNIPVEVVMINQNETTQRVSAAIEAGTMPDALDMGRDLMLLLSRNSNLEALDDVYATVGDAHGGWLKPRELAGAGRGVKSCTGDPSQSTGRSLDRPLACASGLQGLRQGRSQSLQQRFQ